MPDRGDESDATVDGAQASFACLNDDVLLLVVAFLPACRDVLSLSVTRALPETVWRAAHKGLLPGLHHQPRRTHVYPGRRFEIPACQDAHPVRVTNGPKTWRERFVGGARLLSRDAEPTVVETVLPCSGDPRREDWDPKSDYDWTLVCVREDGVALLRDFRPEGIRDEQNPAGRIYRPHRTTKVSEVQFWGLAADGSLALSRRVPLAGSWREFMIDGNRLAVVDYAFDNITIYVLPTLDVKQRIEIEREPAGPTGVPSGSQLLWDCGCAYNRLHNEFVFGLSRGIQICFGTVLGDKLQLYVHQGEPHAHETFGGHYYPSERVDNGWQVKYDRVLSTLVFFDRRHRSIFIWNLGTLELKEVEGYLGAEISTWSVGPEMILHTLELTCGRGPEAIHFVSDELDDLICPHGRTMVVAGRDAIHVFEVGGTHTLAGAPPERAGRPAQLYYSIDLTANGPPDWIDAFDEDDDSYCDYRLRSAIVPHRSTAGVALMASLAEKNRHGESGEEPGPLAWVLLDLATLRLETTLDNEWDNKSVTDREIASARDDIVSPDGRTWFIPVGYPGYPSLVPLEMLRVSPMDAPPPPPGTLTELTFGDCDAVFSRRHFPRRLRRAYGDTSTPTTSTTCLRGDAAANWPEEHILEYREDQVGNPWARALKPPPLFMIGNCLLVWSNRNRGRRAQFTVWRF